MADINWKQTAQELPPENVVVSTISPASGMEQTLKREGNLWWAPDGSMYVYYTPSMWRFLEPEPQAREPKPRSYAPERGYSSGYGYLDYR